MTEKTSNYAEHPKAPTAAEVGFDPARPDPATILAQGVAAGDEFTHVRDMFETDLATASLGIKITDITASSCDGHFTVCDFMCNGHGTTQGGFLYTFADSLFAGACNAAGTVAVAAYNSIHYLRPVWGGSVVHGHAEIRNTWGKSGTVDVELTVDGTVVADFRGTFRMLGGKPSAR